MELTHFYGLLPLIAFLVLSLVFYGKGLVHLITLGYNGALAYIAIINNWEVLFFMPIAMVMLIGIILFWYSMVRGNWL